MYINFFFRYFSYLPVKAAEWSAPADNCLYVCVDIAVISFGSLLLEQFSIPSWPSELAPKENSFPDSEKNENNLN